MRCNGRCSCYALAESVRLSDSRTPRRSRVVAAALCQPKWGG